MPTNYWSIPPLWKGEDAFVIGGGPSVTAEDIESLRGRRTIVVNQSYLKADFCDYLFFADLRWWDREFKERNDKLLGFKGEIITTCTQAEHERLKYLKRIVPVSARTGMSKQRDTVCMERTSLQGAMNVCYHLGARRIILLGADNRDAPNGRIHHHDEYPWVRHHDSWDIKGEQFGYGAAALENLGVPVINVSMVSTLTFWPKRPLADVIKEIDNG